jgi:transcriptional regulator GlxA family with amidase domain
VKTIGIVLFDGVEELDAVGPYDVLAAWTQVHPDDGWTVTTLSRLGGGVRAAKGLGLLAEHAFDTAPPLDVLVYPGGRGTRPLLRDPEHLDLVRAWADRASIVASVCTGALVLAAAGLLRGRPATTYWENLDELSSLDPTLTIDAEARFVDDGDVITSAGVSAGIDMALHLVSRLAGVERARQVRRAIQYDPEPPV